ncbi:MAG: DUF1631 family protein [Pseudomonadota bacterium]
MANPANSMALTAPLRRHFVDGWLGGLPTVVQNVDTAARALTTQVTEPLTMQRRRVVVEELRRSSALWLSGMLDMLTQAGATGALTTRMQNLGSDLSLVDNNTIESEILGSRLALAMMDKASSEFNDLRARVTSVEQQDELDSHDVLRPHVISRVVINAWCSAGLTLEHWRTLNTVLSHEFSTFAQEAYHEANRWLLNRGVRPEIDLRPMVRRTRNGLTPGGTEFAQTGSPATSHARTDLMPERPGTATARGGPPSTSAAHHTPRAPGPREPSEALLGRLNRLVGRQLPGFGQAAAAPTQAVSSKLSVAIADAQQNMARRADATAPGVFTTATGAATSPPVLLEELNRRKQALKSAASTPVERATIEIVALLFQSILTEERIPAVVRVWFARLQMPVLRVAVGEPDFFATTDHPARRLIDRMGASVMGFDPTHHQPGDALDKEIKRVVQVVEAYPDTGRRVFQTVLTEFERFLEHYFKNENEASRKGVSLAQQVEQRETLAIQYTIELRKMLNEVPVQEGVREFLFQVWADVLATSAIKTGVQGDETKLMKRTAADLIWSASAKVSRDERAEVIRRLPGLLKNLREGMQRASIPIEKQDDHIQNLNNSLAVAFTAKTASIPHDRLKDLMAQLETLEELLPDAADVEIDESMVLDLSGYESSELEVVAEGGSMPTAAMLAWAKELQVGSWLMLDYRDRSEAVQLAWQGMRKQLSLFVSPQGRGILFQQRRLAAFLQAGLLVPAQEESLTTRATRTALEKLDADPSKLLD